MRLTPKQQADAKAATNWKLKAFNAMVCDPRLNGTDIRVAWRIIDRMNVKCQSHPGHKLISEEIGCTRQTVLRSTARLEGFGYFDIAKGGGKGKSHSYTLIRETVRDDGQYQKKPRSADSVRGLKRGCPSPSSKVVRDDGQEPTKEPFMEPIKGGPAASPPEDGGAPSKKKDGLHGHAATYIPRENDGFDAASTHVLVLDGLRTAGFGNKGAWGFVLENWPVEALAA